MKNIHLVLAGLALGLPVVSFAQPDLAAASYVGMQLGTGKVSLNCPANAECSPVDTNQTYRFGYRFNPSWAMEVSYAHTDADWGFLNRRYSAKFTGFGVGAAYALPLSSSVSTLFRFGASVNELELQPATSLGQANPGTTNTRSVKPYVGVALSWQFARHWSTSLNADFTRADARDTAGGPKQSVTVRTLGAGIALHF